MTSCLFYSSFGSDYYKHLDLHLIVPAAIPTGPECNAESQPLVLTATLDTGVISSHNYPRNAADQLYCEFTIQANDDTQVFSFKRSFLSGHTVNHVCLYGSIFSVHSFIFSDLV